MGKRRKQKKGRSWFLALFDSMTGMVAVPLFERAKDLGILKGAGMLEPDPFVHLAEWLTARELFGDLRDRRIQTDADVLFEAVRLGASAASLRLSDPRGFIRKIGADGWRDSLDPAASAAILLLAFTPFSPSAFLASFAAELSDGLEACFGGRFLTSKGESMPDAMAGIAMIRAAFRLGWSLAEERIKPEGRSPEAVRRIAERLLAEARKTELFAGAECSEDAAGEAGATSYLAAVGARRRRARCTEHAALEAAFFAGFAASVMPDGSWRDLNGIKGVKRQGMLMAGMADLRGRLTAAGLALDFFARKEAKRAAEALRLEPFAVADVRSAMFLCGAAAGTAAMKRRSRR